MSFLHKLAIFLTISSLLTLSTPLKTSPLAARLAAGLTGSEKNGMMDCWNSLTELQSCTNEIVLFFLNGDSYLSLECCRAIRVITGSCWPAVLGSLGFTAEEADILKGYCGTDTAGAPPSLPPSGSAPADEYKMEETVA